MENPHPIYPSQTNTFKNRAEEFARNIAQVTDTKIISAFKRNDWLSQALGYKGHTDLLKSAEFRKQADSNEPLIIFASKELRLGIVSKFAQKAKLNFEQVNEAAKSVAEHETILSNISCDLPINTVNEISSCPICDGQIVNPKGQWFCVECMADQETLDTLKRGYGKRVYRLINDEGFTFPRTKEQAMQIALDLTYQERPRLRDNKKLAQSVSSTLANELELATGLRQVPAVTVYLSGLDQHRHKSIIRHKAFKAMQSEAQRGNIKLLIIEDSSNLTEAILTIDGFGINIIPEVKTKCTDLSAAFRAVIPGPTLVVQERWNQYEFSRI